MSLRDFPPITTLTELTNQNTSGAQSRSLRHIARYHTEVVDAGRSRVEADSQRFFQPDAGARSSTQETESFRQHMSSPAASTCRDANGSGGGGSGYVDGGGGGVDGSRDPPNNGGRDQDLGDRRLPPPRSQRRQLACPLLMSLYMDYPPSRLTLLNERRERRRGGEGCLLYTSDAADE